MAGDLVRLLKNPTHAERLAHALRDASENRVTPEESMNDKNKQQNRHAQFERGNRSFSNQGQGQGGRRDSGPQQWRAGEQDNDWDRDYGQEGLGYGDQRGYGNERGMQGSDMSRGYGQQGGGYRQGDYGQSGSYSRDYQGTQNRGFEGQTAYRQHAAQGSNSREWGQGDDDYRMNDYGRSSGREGQGNQWGRGQGQSQHEMGNYGGGHGNFGTQAGNYGGRMGGFGGGSGNYGNQGYSQSFGGQGGSDQGQTGGRTQFRSPKGYTRSDDRIREDVCDRLGTLSGVDPSEVEVSVRDGEVTITGTVRERWQKHQIENAADAISGVKEIHNQIRVKQHEDRSDTASSSSSATAMKSSVDNGNRKTGATSTS